MSVTRVFACVVVCAAAFVACAEEETLLAPSPGEAAGADAGDDGHDAGSVPASPEGGTKGDAAADEDDGGPSLRPTGPSTTCKASYYQSGSTTASGEPFDPDGLTAAHKTLPFDTMLRVTNPATGASVDVRINDRGPFTAGRCLDLARGAFEKIAPLAAGVVTVEFVALE